MRLRGRTAVLLLVCLALAAGLWWMVRPDPGPSTTTARAPVGATATRLSDSPASPPAAAPGPGAVGGGGSFHPVTATVSDRALRDDIRRRILAAWLESVPTVEAPVDAGPGDFVPMPVLDGGTVDPEYLRARIREDFVPMARACYEQLLTRQPGAAGRAVTEFVIVGDERVGGVVDEVAVLPTDGGLTEEGFATCLRESMSAMAFRPPPGRGSLRVRYPFTFSPDPADAASPTAR